MLERAGTRERPVVASDVPGRLDRLQWSRFHWLVVFALGITWILDGLEVTLAGSVSGALKASPRLHLTDELVGAAASSAYLTVSESFPVEVRALAIAVFYAFGTALGGIAAPWVFGSLIGTGDPAAIAGGYLFGAALMAIAAGVELWLGVAAERRSLEEVARPLSSV